MRTISCLAATVAVLLAATLSCCSDRTPVKIGFSGQLTGKFSDLGVQGRNGAILAVETLNAAGGILGRPLVLLAEDDLDTPAGAIAADNSLLRQGAVAIIGHMTSNQTLAAMPAIREAKAILVSPTSATPVLTGIRDSFFRVIPTNAQWASALARHALGEGRSRAFFVGDSDNTGYTDAFREVFTQSFTAGGGVIAGEWLYAARSGTDWSHAAAAIMNAKPDVVVACTSARDLVGLAQVLQPNERGIRVMGPTWPSTLDLLLLGGRNVESFEFVTNYTDDNERAEFTQFRERYRKRFGWEPSFAAAYAYEAVELLAHALSKTGGSREGLAEALVDGFQHPGIIGPFSLDTFGDVKRPSFVIHVANGHYATKLTLENSP